MLHIVYRSYGGENLKNRPHFYSKLLALVSFVRAVDAAGHKVEVLFLNDGPIPKDRLAVMEAAGEIVAHQRLGLRGSYHRGLALPLERGWPDEHLVWFAEDDYLYQPQALRDLIAASVALPQADYLALYASIGGRQPAGDALPDHIAVPRRWQTAGPVMVNRHTWQRGLSTTWTFGVRMRALRRDHRILSLTDYAGLTGCDHAQCLHYQGFLPFPWSLVGRHLLFFGDGSFKTRAKRCLAAPIKAAVNCWSLLRTDTGHQLWAADPALITHMESGTLGIGTDWRAVARSSAAWANDRGLSVDVSPAVLAA